MDEEASHSESSTPFRFIYFPGQIREVVFLALDSVVICKSRANSGSPVGASVQMTENRFPGTVSFCRPTNFLPHPELSFRLGLSSSCHPSRHRLIKSSRPPHKRRGVFFFCFFFERWILARQLGKKSRQGFCSVSRRVSVYI